MSATGAVAVTGVDAAAAAGGGAQGGDWPMWCVPLSAAERAAMPLVGCAGVRIGEVTHNTLVELATAAYRVEGAAGVRFACAGGAPLECSDDEWTRVVTGDNAAVGASLVRLALRHVADKDEREFPDAIAELARAYAGPLPSVAVARGVLTAKRPSATDRVGYWLMCAVAVARHAQPWPRLLSYTRLCVALRAELRATADLPPCTADYATAQAAAAACAPARAGVTAAHVFAHGIAAACFADMWGTPHRFTIDSVACAAFGDAVVRATAPTPGSGTGDVFCCVVDVLEWANKQGSAERAALRKRLMANQPALTRIALHGAAGPAALARRIIEIAIGDQTTAAVPFIEVAWSRLGECCESLPARPPTGVKRQMHVSAVHAPAPAAAAASPSGSKRPCVAIDVADDDPRDDAPAPAAAAAPAAVPVPAAAPAAAPGDDSHTRIAVLIEPYNAAATELAQLQTKKKKLDAALQDVKQKMTAAEERIADVVVGAAAGPVCDLLRKVLARRDVVYDAAHVACAITGQSGTDVDAICTLARHALPSIRETGRQALTILLAGTSRTHMAARIVAGIDDARAAPEWLRQTTALHLAVYLSQRTTAQSLPGAPEGTRDAVAALLESCERTRRGDPPPEP